MQKAYLDLDAQVIIDGNRIFTEFKGALTEQYVLQQLIAAVSYTHLTLPTKSVV